MDDFTRKFDAAQDKDEQIHYILTSVYEALKDQAIRSGRLTWEDFGQLPPAPPEEAYSYGM